mmetsp:Transcript_25434/g.76671  ORF Transcript_25434/g.76671 Transcript_25434/m.76671 type:complete len:252 (-) Transcript_25434:1424-2179(-)
MVWWTHIVLVYTAREASSTASCRLLGGGSCVLGSCRGSIAFGGGSFSVTFFGGGRGHFGRALSLGLGGSLTRPPLAFFGGGSGLGCSIHRRCFVARWGAFTFGRCNVGFLCSVFRGGFSRCRLTILATFSVGDGFSSLWCWHLRGGLSLGLCRDLAAALGPLGGRRRLLGRRFSDRRLLRWLLSFRSRGSLWRRCVLWRLGGFRLFEGDLNLRPREVARAVRVDLLELLPNGRECVPAKVCCESLTVLANR